MSIVFIFKEAQSSTCATKKITKITLIQIITTHTTLINLPREDRDYYTLSIHNLYLMVKTLRKQAKTESSRNF